MKPRKLDISPYLSSTTKRVLDICLSIIFLLLSSPIFILIICLVLVTSSTPLFFLQERIGRKGRKFRIIKFRTMLVSASKKQVFYKSLNEADGPVFKIKNDPRFTKVGKILSRTGLDELPQFINVLKNEMSIVGPRPLPTLEAHRLSNLQRIREIAKPGITSNWVVNGSHGLSFKKWMSLDNKYIANASFSFDLDIIYRTFVLTINSLFLQIKNH